MICLRIFSRLAACGLVLVAFPLSARPPVPALPLGSPGDWIGSGDYPTFALRHEFEGVTRFTLMVDQAGRVSACTIVVSSGSEVLDEATCRLLTLRARFSPALDKKGRAVSGSYQSSVRWQIPRDQEPPKASELVSTILVSPEGKAIECGVEKSAGEAAIKNPIGPKPCPKSDLVSGYFDAQGQPVAKRLRYTFKLELVDVSPAELEAAKERAVKARVDTVGQAAAALDEAAKAADEAAKDQGGLTKKP